jgi:PPM family protein phosphatase
VGDSRCYRVRSGQIQLLTRDHSLINDYLVAMPDLTEEQRSELPKNVITRALGMQDQVVVDLQHDDPLSGDVYVLCSDGLSGMIQDDEIQRIVATAPDIRSACKQLIERANEHGGEDNITAVLIKIEEMRDSQSDVVSGNADTERGNRLAGEARKAPVSPAASAETPKPPSPKPVPNPADGKDAGDKGSSGEVKVAPDLANLRAATSDTDFAEAETSPGFVLVGTPTPPKKPQS